MSNFLREISASEVNFSTKNGGASAQCKSWAVQQVIEAGLCVGGATSSCAASQRLKQLLDKYC